MEKRQRFVEKEEWVTWFKVLLYFIIAYYVIILVGAVISLAAVITKIMRFSQIQGMTSSFWLSLIFGSVLSVVAIVGAVMTLKMKKWGLYVLIGTQLVNMISAFALLFTSGGDFASFIGALIASCFLPVILLISVYSGAASTTGKNPFAPKY